MATNSTLLWIQGNATEKVVSHWVECFVLLLGIWQKFQYCFSVTFALKCTDFSEVFEVSDFETFLYLNFQSAVIAIFFDDFSLS